MVNVVAHRIAVATTLAFLLFYHRKQLSLY